MKYIIVLAAILGLNSSAFAVEDDILVHNEEFRRREEKKREQKASEKRAKELKAAQELLDAYSASELNGQLTLELVSLKKVTFLKTLYDFSMGFTEAHDRGPYHHFLH